MRRFTRLTVSLKYFRSEKYCVKETVVEIKLVICGLKKLMKRKHWISVKHIFVTGASWNYKLRLGICLFLLWNKISPKELTSSCAKRICADLIKQYNNMELKTFRKALSLVSNFFRFGWLKKKKK